MSPPPLSLSPPPPSGQTRSWRVTFAAVIANDGPLQIVLRTYSLCLSLALSPALLPAVFASLVHPKTLATRARILWRTLLRELQPTGFASAMTVAVGGGAALQRLWHMLERRHSRHWSWIRYIDSKSSLFQRAFLANAVSSALAVTLLRSKRHKRLGTVSPTLDLGLLFLVRALDAAVQAALLCNARKIVSRQVHPTPHRDVALRPSSIPFTPSEPGFLDKHSEDLAKGWQNKVATCLDALVFWASSARIMWCFFYQPERLSPSFARWIHSLANVDKRLLELLRALREGTWSYIRGSPTKRDIIHSLVEELGYPLSWGDPTALPAYGGNFANGAWKRLEVEGRSGIGGLPCQLVHGGIGATFGLQSSCAVNAAIRSVYAFAQAFALYLPVHFLPVLLSRPSSIMRPHRALSTLLSAIRSATFLSAFVSSCWFTVCFARTLVLARLFPNISHDVWDGPYGGTLAGSLMCGTSIWIENAKRRREVALYVLPKALRASIPKIWLRSRHPVFQLVESLTFTLSLASLLTFAVHQPESLRGLSNWTLTFVMKGSNTGLWKKHGRDFATSSTTPVDSSIPPPADCGCRED